MSNIEKCHDCGQLSEDVYLIKHYSFVVCRKCAEDRGLIKCIECEAKDKCIAELENQCQILEDNQEYNFSKDRNNLAIEKLGELKNSVTYTVIDTYYEKNNETVRDYTCNKSYLEDKINTMIAELKGAKDE